jgi:hypothetical protein
MKNPQQQIAPRVGQINGTITWARGQVPITLGKVGIPGQIIGVKDAISIVPITVRIVHRPSDEFQSTIEQPINGAGIEFSRVAVSGQKVSVSYSVSKLPIGVSIQLRVEPRQVDGTFSRSSNPQDTLLDLSRSVTNGFDFVYVEPPK